MSKTSFDPQRIRRAVWLGGLSFATFLGITAWLLSQLDATALPRLLQLGTGLVAILLGLSLANYALRALRWVLFSSHLGLQVPWLCNSSYYVAGFVMTPTPGKLGELMRLWLIRRGHEESYHRSLPLALGDRVGDTYAVVTLCLITGAMLGEQLPALALVLGGLTLMTLCLLYPPPLMRAIDRLYGRVKRYPHAFAAARHALHQLSHLMSARIAVPALLLSLAGWLAECMGLQLLLQALGQPVTLTQATFAFTFSMFVGGLSMLPGGLGATEAGLAFVLMSFGVDPAVAVLATALIRITTLWFAVALGLVALPLALHLSRPLPSTPLHP